MPAIAQAPEATIDIAQAVPLVYEQVPFLPLENQYLTRSGDPFTESTLLSRMMRYHTSVRRRIPYFRLDWKLTLADYLGVNDRIYAETYPNANILQENPMEGDVEVVRQLSRSQRDALVEAIVLTLNPLAQQAGSTTSPALWPSTPTPAGEPASRPTPPASTPREPRPGDAQLLLP